MIDMMNNELARKLLSIDGSLDFILGHDCFVAGGAIRSIFTNEPINDIDVFGLTTKQLQSVLDHVHGETLTTNNAVTLKTDKTTYQFVTIVKGAMEEVLNTFDFHCCMGAYDGIKFTLHEDFLLDNSMRRLTINHTTINPISTLIRVRKYLGKGYTVSVAELFKLAFIINKLNIRTMGDALLQMNAVEERYLQSIYDDMEKEKDKPFTIEKFIEICNNIREVEE